ncbi:retrovirus-related pol polyprotein from transposon TNT 1-94 [Tanacetum coccineum]|uniref:Retrovirus-related pol polyprotein from transposon TNT 1-94 n=1 Tax=Tanacetum coccineum TaxID=301880 RepID=A0ABQ5DQQ7_9ASTR
MANDDSQYPMQGHAISLLTYLKEIRKFTIQSFRTISEIQMSSSNVNVMEIRRDTIIKVSRFQQYELVRTKDQREQEIAIVANLGVRVSGELLETRGERVIEVKKFTLSLVILNIRTDNGTEFVNQTLKTYYEDVGISHQTLVARTLQQNGVVERRYQTLVEPAHTMLIFSKAPLYLWAEAVATTSPIPTDTTGTTSSTSIDQDAPSTKPSSEESSSRDVITANLYPTNPPFKHLSKWIKNHPLDNVIGNPSRPVSTRHQLQTDAMWCYFDAFLTLVEPKNYKEALKESSCIEAM